MKRILALLFALVMTVAGWSQAPASPKAPPAKPKPSPFAGYAGLWTSTFDGKVWLRLQLTLQAEQLTGWMQHATSLSLNDDGSLKSVSEDQSNQQVQNATVNPDGLLLVIQDPSSQETERYVMKLVVGVDDTAELKMIAMEMPPGMAKPKPWRLVKSAADDKAAQR